MVYCAINCCNVEVRECFVALGGECYLLIQQVILWGSELCIVRFERDLFH
jgi:hypothetical protein